MENMKCPHRIIKQIQSMVKLGDKVIIEESEIFADCLKEQCMAYRKHRRVEMCQKFPMGYYKDLLD